MARLFDKALAYQPTSGRNAALFAELRGGLQWATPLVCDDLLSHVPNEEGVDDLTGLRVPWPVALVEWRNNGDIDLGAVAFEVPADQVPGRTPATGVAFTVLLRFMSSRRREPKVLAQPAGVDIDVTELGRVVDSRIRFLEEDFWERMSPENAMTFLADTWGIAHVAGWFIMAANARNIDVETVEPPNGMSRNWRRRTGQPLHAYRRVLLPHSHRGGVGGRGGSGGRPLEIVKGHFKIYDERPLFGRITGTWWWSPFARGDPAAGSREHDYAFGPEAPLADNGA